MSCFEFNMWLAYFEQQRLEIEQEQNKYKNNLK